MELSPAASQLKVFENKVRNVFQDKAFSVNCGKLVVLRLVIIGKTDIENSFCPSGSHISHCGPEKLSAFAEITVVCLEVFGRTQYIQSRQTLAGRTELAPKHIRHHLGGKFFPPGKIHRLIVDENDNLTVHHHQIRTFFKIDLPNAGSDLRSGRPFGQDLSRSFNNRKELAFLASCSGKGHGSALFAGTGKGDLLTVKTGADLYRITRFRFGSGKSDGGKRRRFCPGIFVIPCRGDIKLCSTYHSN